MARRHRLSPGLFGLLFGSKAVVSAIVWAAIGGICGGLYSYYVVRLASKSEMTGIGAQLPAPSSALALFVETTDARRGRWRPPPTISRRWPPWPPSAPT